MAWVGLWDVCLGVVESGESPQPSARAVRDNLPYLYIPGSVGCASFPGFVEQWSDQSSAFGDSGFAVFSSSGGEMESWGSFINDRLDP